MDWADAARVLVLRDEHAPDAAENGDCRVMSAVIVTLADAKAHELKHYFTGLPCKRGHVCERQTSNRGCVQCTSDRDREWWHANPDRIDRGAAVERVRLWRLANPERVAAQRLLAKERNATPPRPTPAKDAESAGLKVYYTGKPCTKGHSDGRFTSNNRCVACHKEKSRAKYYLNKEAIRAKSRAHYTRNRETIRTQQAEKNAANPEINRARVKAWRAENIEAKRALHRKRRALKRAAEGCHTGEEIEALKVAQKYRCANPACRKSIRLEYHADHINPLARGGTNWIRNIQLLCPPCNCRKSASDPIEWAQRNGRLI